MTLAGPPIRNTAGRTMAFFQRRIKSSVCADDVGWIVPGQEATRSCQSKFAEPIKGNCPNPLLALFELPDTSPSLLHIHLWINIVRLVICYIYSGSTRRPCLHRNSIPMVSCSTTFPLLFEKDTTHHTLQHLHPGWFVRVSTDTNTASVMFLPTINPPPPSSAQSKSIVSHWRVRLNKQEIVLQSMFIIVYDAGY